MLGRLFRALRKSPARPAGDDELRNVAATHFLAGRYSEARPLYESLYQREADDAEVLFRLGVIYANGGKLDTAGAMLARAARRHRDSVEIINAQANVAWLQAAWPEAERLFKAALELGPGNSTVLANYGLCLHDAGRLTEAADMLQRALLADPRHIDALVNMALVHIDLGDAAAAAACLQRALAAAPDCAEAHALLAQLLLRQEQYARGWLEYEWRLRCHDTRYREDRLLPRWDGSAAPALALQVYAEQGIGDQIMFASCLPDAAARVASCDVECEPRLFKLFSRSFPALRFHPQQPDHERPWVAQSPQAAAHIQIGSLPGQFRRDRGQFPAATAYLKADASRVAYWASTLAALGSGLKVGIVWRGGVPRTRLSFRSMALTAWLPILQLRGAHFISLQHGDCADDLAALAAHTDVRVSRWQSAIDDVDETAALIGALDLVICVCGSVVHLAGALGKEVLVMVPACPEWRYLEAGHTMPWYPAVKLLRQTRLGEWTGVISTVVQQLSARIAGEARQ
jgi:Tfp pilus assembly protein PilF